MATDLALAGEVSETGLELPLDLDFDRWQEVGRTLARIERACMWWIGDWWRHGEHVYGERAAQALESDLAYQTWRDAGWVSGAVETSRRRDSLSWSHHKEVAALEPAEQDHWLNRAESEDLNRNDLRKLIRETKQAEPPPLPVGEYSILLADPPWRYDQPGGQTPELRGIEENHYPTMEDEEIAALEPPAAANAVLFLWATNPKLLEALEVMEAWDFEYRTNAVWVKDRFGMGYYVRGQHELLLIGKRGEGLVPAEADRPASVIDARREAHSAKPDAAYLLIEGMYPTTNTPRHLELFARRKREGWVPWGNEQL